MTFVIPGSPSPFKNYSVRSQHTQSQQSNVVYPLSYCAPSDNHNIELSSLQIARSQRAQSTSQPTILLIADSELSSKLVRFLDNQQYRLLVASELVAAQRILRTAPINFSLLHCPPDRDPKLNYGGWETYTQLRHSTDKPLIWVPNITFEHFTEAGETSKHNTLQMELMNYRKLVDQLCHFVACPDRPTT